MPYDAISWLVSSHRLSEWERVILPASNFNSQENVRVLGEGCDGTIFKALGGFSILCFNSQGGF
jgi:hypothetical protein